MTRLLTILILIVLAGNLFAQKERSHVRKGNEYYNEGKLDKASDEYNKALEYQNNLKESIFNLGNVAYKKKDYQTAAKQFETASMLTEDKDIKAEAYHNMGNALLEAKQYDKSIEAYKNALRLNPKDQDTRYNLAYAMEMLKNNPQQQNQNQQNKDQQNKDKNKQNKDQQNKDQQKQDQQKQDQEKQNQQQQSQQQKQQQQKEQQQQQQQAQQQEGQKKEGQQQQARQGQLTKEEAERLLEALRQQEQNVQEKLAKKKIKGEKKVIEKDW